ncbi:MAG TPA: TAT-variant-translocated molybdopterin oxidoreductase [Pyrinomonadaceae bacterium]|nr:TAT-variant-translocated molybdopterin oxidoreductase [Pyrinomonadaceae bacterium]
MHIKDTFPELYQIRKQRPLSVEGVRDSLSKKRGREFWQSLEELADSEEFEELLHREFPQHASEWDEGTDRRTFLKLMGASLALAGLSGCVYQPPETIVPYVKQPEEVIPGKSLYFATAMPWTGGCAPLLVRSYMGRPNKVEGNDLHPASLGATDVFAQASILNLYDPDRSETIINRGETRTYTAFLGEISTALVSLKQKQGAGLRFLTETVMSPTLAAQLGDVLRAMPGARWYQWEPAGNNNARLGARQAAGDFATPVYNFAAADRVLSLDSNFLECGPNALRYARDFASRRRTSDGDQREISRLYSLETTPTNTGFFADERLAVKPSEFAGVVGAIAAGVGAGGGAATLSGPAAQFASSVAADLKAHAGACLVIAGDEQGPEIHALAHAMNAALGNTGKTVNFVEPVEENPTDQLQDLRTLISEIDAGAVEALVILGGNPVFTTPADLKLDETRMKKVPLTVHLSLYEDETSELCVWHVPEAHYLEAWGDTRAYDGTVTIMQPLIEPLYNGKSAYEVVAAFTDRPDRKGYDIVRNYWLTQGRAALMSAGASNAANATGGTSAGGAADAASGTTTATGGANSSGQGSPAAGATSASVTGNNATSPAAGGAAGNPSASSGQTAPPARTAQGGATTTTGSTATTNQGGQTRTNGGAATSGAAPTPTPEFEKAWRKALNDGFIANTARRPRAGGAGGGGAQNGAGGGSTPRFNPLAPPEGAAQQPVAPTPAPNAGANGGPFEIVFRTDPCVYDGRFANNGWLQELPKPLTKLTWDNVAIISPATAAKLDVGDTPDGATSWDSPKRVNRITAKGGEMRNELLRLTFKGRKSRKGPVSNEEQFIPVFILPGQPDDVVTVHLGYGRWRSGVVGGNEHNKTVMGYNAYDIRTSDALWSGAGLAVEKNGDDYPLASSQIHFRMEGRDIVRHGTFADWTRDPELAPPREHSEPPEPAGENRTPEQGESLYPQYDYSEHEDEGLRGYKWGMAIDLSTCVGCNACVVACVAENNIPVVGKEQVARSREMHWLRVDAYFRGAVENPAGVYFMPVPCMHCENAPCEGVCPVHATVHSAEGINEMVYNRCVGTRYCSNNCPYKVRRFNFLLFQDWDTPSYKMMRNPEVSVRSRGVMEKCTYCVQRIEYAKIEAEKRGDKVKDGEIKTACQQTCPTEAIVFGDINDPASRVAKLKAQKRNYGLLADLNTHPRTTYLASVRNPNDALPGGKVVGPGESSAS